MERATAREVFEAEELLKAIQSWSETEVEELPRFYREKAEEYRDLMNSGDT